MDAKIKTLFEQVNVTEKELFDVFESALLKNVIVHQKDNSWTFVIEVDTTLDSDIYFLLEEKMEKGFANIKKTRLEVVPRTIDNSKIPSYFEKTLEKIKDISIVAPLFKDSLVMDEDVYKIEVRNDAEYHQVKEMLPALNYWYHCYGFDFSFNILLNEEKRAEIKEKIAAETNEIPSSIFEEKKGKTDVSSVPTKGKGNYYRRKTEKDANPDCILGRTIQDTPVSIQGLIGEDNNITIEGYVFGVDFFESAKTDFKIITLKITDYTDSIYCKVFTRDEEEYLRLSKALKKGSWLKVRGYTKNDSFAKELVLNIRDIMKIDAKKEEITDTASEKRVELHAHTKMSQMDGVMDEVAYVNQAIRFGHKACAVTDHNGCQAFPHVFNTVTSYNKGKEDKDKFKAIYGTELTMVDDSVDIVIRGTDDKFFETTFVVFDFETTGFNAGGLDSIIEAGAVKILDGEIVDRFDELINPGRPLPEKITEVTKITNDMLKDKPSEEEVIKRFIDWVGDLPMVAHNAKFDVSFLEMAYKKYNFGTFENCVIDTLKLSQTLDNTFARHSLSALVKRYDVKWDEDAHHRADYDAEGTALVFHKMLKKMNANNFETINDMNKLVSKDEIYKYGVTHHINILAQNKTGLKNLFKIISLANTKYLYKFPRIPRSELENLREGLLIGSGCYESEVFKEARSKSDEELVNVINFYDYVEVQPLDCYIHLLQMHDFDSRDELEEHIKKIVRTTKDAGKIIVATGDVHQLTKEDKIYREIIVNQKVPGGGRHPLARNEITKIPSQHFRTTDEMLSDFEFLGEDLAYEIVVTNTQKIADSVDIIEVIIDTGGIPFSPRIDKSQETVTELVFGKATSWYGDPLPHNILERISKELYGDGIYEATKYFVEKDSKLKDEELIDEIFKSLQATLLKGFDEVKKVIGDFLGETIDGYSEMETKEQDKIMKKKLGGVIGGGFDVIYLIAQKLVKHSNDEGYLVGSRGSVGSSFVATMMGITEVNPLPAHYLCRDCHYSEFNDQEGKPYGLRYSSGYDLPSKECPICHKPLAKEGQDMPFATFLGFNADKVPDIDLNFSGDNQASAHAYTKVLFGEDNVYRAGTIGTVADKTAFGYVKGYCEDKGITNMRTAEVERIALGCTGVKRTTGQHPGGIVVIPGYMDVFDFTPFQYPADDPNSEWRTTHFEYHAIDQDVLKLDILGHDDPTVLRMLQDLSGIDVTTLPFDDQKVYSLLSSPKELGVTEEEILCPTGTLGLPELGTRFVIQMLVETKPKTFAGLVKISGLSHGTDVWNGNASELIKNNIVPFDDVIGCRDDIMVSLMNWGMEPIRAFKIMEFVRKGKAKKEPDNWAGISEEMKNAGIPEWYIESCHKIQYMFPKAHACAYVMSALRIAWFKLYQPINYYAAFFSIRVTDFDIETMIKGYDAIKEKMLDIQTKGFEASNKETAIIETLRVALEATARGIKFAPLDLNKSDAKNFVIDKEHENTLIPSFSTIDGLGGTVAQTIVEERSKKDFLSIEDFQRRGKVSQTLVDKMRLMGMLDGLPESSQMTLF